MDDKSKPSKVFKITKKMKNKDAYFSINESEKTWQWEEAFVTIEFVACNIYKHDVTPTFDEDHCLPSPTQQ